MPGSIVVLFATLGANFAIILLPLVVYMWPITVALALGGNLRSCLVINSGNVVRYPTFIELSGGGNVPVVQSTYGNS